MNLQKEDHPSVKVIIPGVSGAGKTTLFEKLIRRESASWIFLFDHKGGDLARRFNTPPCLTLNELATATDNGGYIIFDPKLLYPGKPEKGFEFFCHYVWHIATTVPGRKIFGSDELDWLIDTRTVPEELLCILDQGRTFQIDCFFCAQSMNGLHNLARKQMTEIFAFRQGDKNGLDFMTEKGFDGEELMNLRNGEWLYKNVSTGKFARGGTAFAPKNSGRNLKGL